MSEKKISICFVGKNNPDIMGMVGQFERNHPKIRLVKPENDAVLETIYGNFFNGVVIEMDFDYQQKGTKESISWIQVIDFVRHQQNTLVFVLVTNSKESLLANMHGADFGIRLPISEEIATNIVNKLVDKINGITTKRSI